MPPAPLPHPASNADAGRFTLGDAIEHRCQVVGARDGALTLRAAVPVAVGERIVAYLDRYGRVAGRVSAAAGDVFTVRPAGQRPLAAPQTDMPGPSRRDERVVPNQTRVMLRLPTGRRLVAQIVDLSRTSVALTCPDPLEEGTTLRVGGRDATVVRRLHRLHGLVFDEPLTVGEFGPDVTL